MACSRCGCKETYEYDEEDAPDDSWERCAACGVVFNVEDHTDEGENEMPHDGITGAPNGKPT